MTQRYLFGPVSRHFAEQKLHEPRQSGLCLTFHPEEGEGDILLQPEDSWDDLLARLPLDWKPDLLALWLAYSTIPACLWSAPVPRLGLAPDWNLMWHYYRCRLPACDWAITDTWGAELFQKAGLTHVRAGNLCGCERVFVEQSWSERSRDIDILVVGNFNPSVQRERMPWLGRIARLGSRWNVVFRAGVFGESYRRLLARSRIVFHASSRHKVGSRAFEAAATGALIFQERESRELPAYFRDRQECVYYRPDEVEEMLVHYLEHEEERRALVEAARARVGHYRFEDFWPTVLDSVSQQTRRNEKEVGPTAEQGSQELMARCWQALQSSHFEDIALVADLEKSVRAEPKSAALHNALGVLLGRQAQNRGTWKAASEVAAECFRRALDCQPGYVLAGFNLAEALAAAGQELAAGEAARRTLETLQRSSTSAECLVDGLPWGPSFDQFHVEWERAAWNNVGRTDTEVREKLRLLRWRLHARLAQWTGELVHGYEAAFLRPDLPSTRSALGTALLRANRPSEALDHLRSAVEDNPLDRSAARDCFRAMGALGDTEGQRQIIEYQWLLSRACPTSVPAEAWFSPPRPKGDELASILILCCNQLEYTRLCLESLLRHTRTPYELILVDNGSTDDTLAYLEEIRRRPGPAHVEIIRNATNLGFAAGCNQALAKAKGRFVVFLNNDVILTNGWLEGLISRSLGDWPVVGLVGPVTNAAPDAQGVRPGYVELAGLDDFAEKRRRQFDGKTRTVNRLTGFCLLVRREVLERIGGLDEHFGIGFFEDDDLCVRAREAGFRLLVALDVYVHHFGSRTFRQLGINTRERLAANFELFRGKWGPEYTSGYRLPPLPAEKEQRAASVTESQSEPGDTPVFTPAPSETGEGSASSPVLETSAQAVTKTAGSDGETSVERDVASVVEPASGDIGQLVGPDSGLRVSLCMIVRNEEHHLPDCLRSVSGLFDETIIVDTGSEDRTRAIAQEFGSHVFDFPWPDSFGAARNESLRHAKGKWILWLDADDRLDEENRHKLEGVLSDLGDELDAYAMKVRSVLDPNRKTFRVLDQVRLFRNLAPVRWDYRIHEQILPAVNRVGGVVRWADVIIDHVGYVESSARRRKLERNLRLLELDHAERPDDSFTLFNLGWTLLDLGRAEEALTHLQKGLEKTNPSSSTLRKLYHLLALTHKHLNHRDEAVSLCREGLKRFPLDAELLCEEGLLLRDQGDFRTAEKSWLALLDARRGQYFASEEIGLRGFRTRQLIAEIYRSKERWIEAEIQWRTAIGERADFEPAWLGLAEMYLRQERWSDLEYLLERLEKEGVTSPKIGWLRARGQIQRREWAIAKRTLAGVISQDKEAVSPRVLLSQVLLQEGRDWEAAERALRDVLELDPKHAETRHNLEVLLRRLGRTASASQTGGQAMPDKTRPRSDSLLATGP